MLGEAVNSALSKLGWLLLAIAGAFCLGVVAIERGEDVNAMWLLAAAIAVYLISYRFYSLFIANTVLGVDGSRITPAVKHNDGLDYVPTDKFTLFGAHFSAIAGAGPLVGPVLAAQMGYLPGTLWILGGVVFAGAVQDMMILFASVRRDAKTLGDMIKTEMGPVTGVFASIGILAILMIIVAVLALIVVKALIHSPWGLFTVAMTIPIAFFMGIYTRYLRPGKVGEVSVIGFALLIASIIYGRYVAESGHFLRGVFDHDGEALAIMLIIYGFCAAVIPVWLLMAPRGLLSTFLKIGVVVLLAVGIVFIRPDFSMPAVTQFIDGTGPVFTGKLFPFLFVTIACGAISGFHATVSSGTTSKMLTNETELRFVAYGGMLMESFVAIMALITASIINPGVYFSMNTPEAVYASAPKMEAAAASPEVDALTEYALKNSTIAATAKETREEVARRLATQAKAAQIYTETLVTPDPNTGKIYTHIEAEELIKWAELVGEPSIMSRTGGAPTLAVGISYILSEMVKIVSPSDTDPEAAHDRDRSLMSFWYHFAIVFEVLFILTTVDAGTRTGRFMIHDLLGTIIPPMKKTDSKVAMVIATLLCVSVWGYFLWNGTVDPEGGVKTLWALFGISNQMLAAIALMFCTVIMFKMKRDRYAWVPAVPAIFVTIVTMVAGLQKLWPTMPADISFVAKYMEATNAIPTAVGPEELRNLELIQSINLTNAITAAFFVVLVVIMVIATIKMIITARQNPNVTAVEVDNGRMDSAQSA